MALERRGDELFIAAAMQPYCRSYYEGALEVVDIEREYLDDDGRPLAPWDLVLMLAGGALAVGIAIVPAISDEPYEEGHYAGIGTGAGLFGLFGLVVLIPQALPDKREEEVVSQTSGGRWAARAERCGDAEAAEVTLSASQGTKRVTWRFSGPPSLTAAPPEITDSLRYWADACQQHLALELRASGVGAGAGADPGAIKSQAEHTYESYKGGDAIESGDKAGRGHSRVQGQRTARLQWSFDKGRTKPSSAAAVVAEARAHGDACLAKARGSFLASCREEVRDRHRGGCETTCKERNDANDCNFEAEDCRLIGGSVAECNAVKARCLRKKGLDPAGLAQCVDACLASSTDVERGDRACEATWKSKP